MNINFLDITTTPTLSQAGDIYNIMTSNTVIFAGTRAYFTVSSTITANDGGCHHGCCWCLWYRNNTNRNIHH